MDFITRLANPADLPALAHIWHVSFGDSDAVINAFFGHYFEPDKTVAAECGGTVAAMGYLLPAGMLRNKDGAVPCSMLYAIAVLPEFRGRGLGKAVTRELCRIAQKDRTAAAICPAEESLFDYYGSNAGFEDWFYIRERRIDASQLPQSRDSAVLRSLDGPGYLSLRERLLNNLPHIEPDLRAISYQYRLCLGSGGGLYAIDLPSGQVCAIVERRGDGDIWIKELLGLSDSGNNADEDAAINALASVFPSKSFLVRSSVMRSCDKKDTRRYGMLIPPPGFPALSGTAGWFGLTFD